MQLVWSRWHYNYIPISNIILRAMTTDVTSLLRQPASLVPANFLTHSASLSNAEVSPPSELSTLQRCSTDPLSGDPQGPERLPPCTEASLPEARPRTLGARHWAVQAGPDRACSFHGDADGCVQTAR